MVDAYVNNLIAAGVGEFHKQSYLQKSVLKGEKREYNFFKSAIIDAKKEDNT